ncbi:hypothetical protein KCV07_g422, partial [Aureobasidium melanogenum]
LSSETAAMLTDDAIYVQSDQAVKATSMFCSTASEGPVASRVARVSQHFVLNLAKTLHVTSSYLTLDPYFLLFLQSPINRIFLVPMLCWLLHRSHICLVPDTTIRRTSAGKLATVGVGALLIWESARLKFTSCLPALGVFWRHCVRSTEAAAI